MSAFLKRSVLMGMLILGVLSGCAFPELGQNQGQVATAAVQTYQVQLTAERPADTATSPPTLEPTLPPPTFTATLEPTFTPTITPSPTETPDPGWSGRWTFFVLMLSNEHFPVDLVQEGDRITSTLYVKGEEYYISGVVDAAGGGVSGAIYFHGAIVAYFRWEMQSGRNLFLGRWWNNTQSGAWCGGRRGVTPPPESECLLRL